ncbi:MAG: hypothetical protein GF332_03380 [Candidatus Moranbacteria bacterium]|nr:hypothetical protein [Candidatus Moranbacteria bacterium]
MQRKANRKFYQVAPMVNIDRHSNQYYTYYSKQEIKFGSLAQVEFRGRLIWGLVLQRKLKPNKTKKYKKIIKIMEEPVLDKKHLDLYQMITDYYLISLTKLLQVVLPQGVNRFQKIDNFKKTIKPGVGFRIKQQEKAIAEKIIGFFKNNKQPVIVQKTERLKILTYLIFKVIKQKKQVLVLCSDDLNLNLKKYHWEKIFGSRNIFTPGLVKQNKNQYLQDWLLMKNVAKKIIIAKKTAVFADFRNLGLIIIDEAHEDSFKQDKKHPRYDTRIIADKFARFYQIPIVYSTNSPRVDFYWQIGEQKVF